MGSTAKEGGGDQEVFVLTWNDFHTQFVSSFQEMRGEGDFLDTTVACSSGDQLKAHKVVLSASSPFFKSLLKNNPSPHPTLVMSSEVKFQDLVRVFEFIYCGVVKVQSQDVESFMNVANLLQIRGLTEDQNKDQPNKQDSKQSDNSSNKPRPQQSAAPVASGSGGSKQPRRRNSSQSSNTEGAGAPATKKFRDYEPPAQQPAASQEQQQIEEGSEAYTSYSEYDNVYADQHYEEQTTPSNGGGSGPSNGAGGPNIQLKGLVCPMCQNVCHDVPSLKMHMSTAHGAGLAKEEESPQKQKPPRKNQKHPNSSPAMERSGGPQQQGTPGGGANDEAVNCDICFKTHKNIKAMKAHRRKYHRAELGLPEAGETGAGEHEYPMMGGDGHFSGMGTPTKRGGRGRGRGRGGRGAAAAQAAAAARAAAQAAADAAMYEEGIIDEGAGDYYDPMVDGTDPDDPDGVGLMPMPASTTRGRGRGAGRGAKRRGGRAMMQQHVPLQHQYDEEDEETGLEEEEDYYDEEEDGAGMTGGDDDGVIMNKPGGSGSDHGRKEKPVGEVQPAPRLKSPDPQQPKPGTSRPAATPKRGPIGGAAAAAATAVTARQPRAPGAKQNKQLQQRFAGSTISITSGPSHSGGSGGRLPANLPPGVSVTKTGSSASGRQPPPPPPPPPARSRPNNSSKSSKRGSQQQQVIAVKEEPSPIPDDYMDDEEIDEEDEYYEDYDDGDEEEEYYEGLETGEAAAAAGGVVASGNVDGSYDNYIGDNNEDMEDDEDEEEN